MQSEQVISRLELSSGQFLTVYDLTKVYFGDYYHVKLEITGEIASSSGEKSAVYRRFLEKMAVPSDKIDLAIQSLLKDFCNSSLHYLNSTDFTDRFIAATSSRKSAVIKRYTGASNCA